jgi:hypothetical protein
VIPEPPGVIPAAAAGVDLDEELAACGLLLRELALVLGLGELDAVAGLDGLGELDAVAGLDGLGELDAVGVVVGVAAKAVLVTPLEMTSRAVARPSVTGRECADRMGTPCRNC